MVKYFCDRCGKETGTSRTPVVKVLSENQSVWLHAIVCMNCARLVLELFNKK